MRLSVYDGLGREAAVLASGLHPAGVHEVVLDGSMLPHGVYLVRLLSGHEERTRTVTLVR